MALALHKRLLHRFIEDLYDEGIVNAEFIQLQAMKQAGRQDFVVRAVTQYCGAAQNLFSLLSNEINQNYVDFYQIEVHARDLYDRSHSVGAELVKMACADIVQSCLEYDKDNCSQALIWTKNEFSQLRRKFETLVQMERKIIDIESGNDTRLLPLI